MSHNNIYNTLSCTFYPRIFMKLYKQLCKNKMTNKSKDRHQINLKKFEKY